VNTPFTAEQFLDVIARYNHGVWPMPLVFYLLAPALVYLALRPGPARSRWIAAILASLWAWMGVVYHWIFFSEINPAAWVFGGAFLVQAALFAIVARRRHALRFRFTRDAPGITGAAFLAYALLLYPLLGALAGHGYPDGPTFGLPCPTTIATFGLLLWARDRVPWWLVAIPALWSVLGLSAAVQFGITEDFGLIAAGVVGTVLVVLHNRHAPPADARNTGTAPA
jgi:hypothetical protein